MSQFDIADEVLRLHLKLTWQQTYLNITSKFVSTIIVGSEMIYNEKSQFLQQNLLKDICELA